MEERKTRAQRLTNVISKGGMDASGFPSSILPFLRSPTKRPKEVPLRGKRSWCKGFRWGRPQPEPRYIEAITQNPEQETTFLLMDAAGISVMMKKR